MENGLVVLNRDTGEITSIEDRNRELAEICGSSNEDDIKQFIEDNHCACSLTYNEFYDLGHLETDTTRYTTKGGEEIVVICEYGYDY